MPTRNSERRCKPNAKQLHGLPVFWARENLTHKHTHGWQLNKKETIKYIEKNNILMDSTVDYANYVQENIDTHYH